MSSTTYLHNDSCESDYFFPCAPYSYNNVFGLQGWRCLQPFTTTTTTHTTSTSTTTTSSTTTTTTTCARTLTIFNEGTEYTDLSYTLSQEDVATPLLQGYVLAGETIQRVYFVQGDGVLSLRIGSTEIKYLSVTLSIDGDEEVFDYSTGVGSFEFEDIPYDSCTISVTLQEVEPTTTTTTTTSTSTTTTTTSTTTTTTSTTSTTTTTTTSSTTTTTTTAIPFVDFSLIASRHDPLTWFATTLSIEPLKSPSNVAYLSPSIKTLALPTNGSTVTYTVGGETLTQGQNVRLKLTPGTANVNWTVGVYASTNGGTSYVLLRTFILLNNTDDFVYSVSFTGNSTIFWVKYLGGAVV